LKLVAYNKMKTKEVLVVNNTGCGCQTYGGNSGSGYGNGFLVILILFILLAILGCYFL